MKDFAEFGLQAVLQPTKDNCQWFLMIDCAVNLKTNIARDLGIEHPAIDLLTLEPVDWSECVSPVLLALPVGGLSEKQSKAWLRFMRRWQYTNALILLESYLPFEKISRALHQRTNAQLPDNMDVVLRFFDTRVFAALTKILDLNQLVAFTCIARQWVYGNRHGQAQVVQADHHDADDMFQPPIEFNVRQEAQLIEAGEVDAMVDLLLNQNEKTLSSLLPPQQYDLISDLLTSAKNYQITQLSDQVAFCKVGLELGKDFHLQSPWETTLTEAMPAKRTFTELLQKNAS